MTYVMLKPHVVQLGHWHHHCFGYFCPKYRSYDQEVVCETNVRCRVSWSYKIRAFHTMRRASSGRCRRVVGVTLRKRCEVKGTDAC